MYKALKDKNYRKNELNCYFGLHKVISDCNICKRVHWSNAKTILCSYISGSLEGPTTAHCDSNLTFPLKIKNSNLGCSAQFKFKEMLFTIAKGKDSDLVSAFSFVYFFD
jgi:hypothetical protein